MFAVIGVQLFKVWHQSFSHHQQQVYTRVFLFVLFSFLLWDRLMLETNAPVFFGSPIFWGPLSHYCFVLYLNKQIMEKFSLKFGLEPIDFVRKFLRFALVFLEIN